MLLFTINFFYECGSFKIYTQPDTWCINELYFSFITNRSCKKKIDENY